MIADSNVSNLAKNRYSQKCVTQIYKALYGDAKFAPFGGTQTWHRDVAKTSVVESCYRNENFYSRALTNVNKCFF